MNARQAEGAIARILQQLETDSGEVVDRVEMVDVEVTRLEDTRPQMWREVSIKTRRLPGHQWAQASEETK
jgi:hypothetical protein